jgi:hypothetical protein
MSHIATKLDVAARVNDRVPFNPGAGVYELNPPIEVETGPVEHVIVSTATHFGTETYVMPCSRDGLLVAAHEIGSFPDVADHSAALRRLGYEVVA